MKDCAFPRFTMIGSPQQILSACAGLFGLLAIALVALPAPAPQAEALRAPLVKERASESAPRQIRRPELPAQIDLAAIPQAALISKAEEPLDRGGDQAELLLPDRQEAATAMTLDVRIVDGDQMAVPYAKVVFYPVSDQGFPVEQFGRSDADGRFESGRLAEGRYRVRIEAEGYRSPRPVLYDIPRPPRFQPELVLHPAGPQD